MFKMILRNVGARKMRMAMSALPTAAQMSFSDVLVTQCVRWS